MPVGVVFEQLPSITINGSPLEIQVPMNFDSESGINMGMSEGVDMMEISRAGEGFSMQPILDVMPPTPDFQISQAGIQPAPEPCTIALGSLAIALIALTRLNKRQQILQR
jgi:hypothetical protein